MNIKDLYGYAYDYYKVYLKQRTESFNFFLILAGLLVSAIAILLAQMEKAPILLSIIAGLLSVALSILSFLFFGLDNRTLKFINKARLVLKEYENRIGTDNPALAEIPFLMGATESLSGRTFGEIKMRTVFRITYLMFAFLGLSGLAGAIALTVE